MKHYSKDEDTIVHLRNDLAPSVCFSHKFQFIDCFLWADVTGIRMGAGILNKDI